MLRSCLVTLLVMLAGSGAAEDSRLERLDVGDEARQWEAVGRLELAGRGFCTGALVAPDLVLTAAHCLYEKATGARIDPARIEFMAGWRNGRAAAYRTVRRAVIHPDYDFDAEVTANRVRNDLALLELHHPIKNTRVTPFETDERPRKGQEIGVVSYAKGRAEAPSLQNVCKVKARQQGVLIMSCDVDFGSSGAPVFSFEGGQPRIVSVVSAMAEVDGSKVSLGTQLLAPLQTLRAALDAGQGVFQDAAPKTFTLGERRDTGAKFARP
ncbi:glutamyl endopeptidase precursor [Roseovarius sp. A-2]|uniref:trypsin-like serine peptidase n=1 Tax=Roseovarius sp. A-2 TaxID=1570360 RepID=UPI0009B53BCE|nr:trypsin-like serine protease [Roseovarius sp. A-2]GAW34666.1 glutamyl endopeptidase precursor [Roseovarius sp. A-2]